MVDILHKIRIHAPQEKVFESLTSQAGLAGWWTQDVKAQARLDAEIHFGFDAGKTVMRFRISELSPPDRVSWRCLDGDSQWKGTLIVFQLSQDGGSTVVHFAQQDWAQATSMFMHCNTKWAYFLLSLKSYCENGVGTPHPDDLKL